MLLWQFKMCNQIKKGMGKGKKMEGVQMKYEMLLKKGKVQVLFILMLCWAIALRSKFVWSVQVACWEAAHLPPQDRLMTLSILNVFFFYLIPLSLLCLSFITCLHSCPSYSVHVSHLSSLLKLKVVVSRDGFALKWPVSRFSLGL